MRYMAVDLGQRRTGVAVGDDETRFIAPVEVIDMPVGEAMLKALDKLIEAHDPGAIIIGLPLNMDGSEGPAAKAARAFGEQLAARTSRTIIYQDERLTSFAAEQHIAGSGRTRKQKKELRDALAAAEILRDYLDARAESA